MTAMAVTKSTQMWLSCFIYQIWVVGDDVAVIDVGVDCFVFAVFAPDCGSAAVVKTFVFGSTRVICVKC